MARFDQLREYQRELIDNTRNAFRKHRTVMIEAPTGSGKSVVLAAIIKMFESNVHQLARGARCYVLVHQTFLLLQMSSHLFHWRVPHGLITSGEKERPAVRTHVCTIQALTNRPPIGPPGLIIIDEAHRTGSKGYRDMVAKYPDTKILGVTATPERGDGKPLATPKGIFETLVPCPIDMKGLTDQGYLCPIRYFAPPIEGLDSVRVHKGDYREIELQEFLKKRKIYGDSIRHYSEIAPGTACLVFCRTLKACQEFALQLRQAGYSPAVLDGGKTKTERERILQGFRDKTITHLVTCKLVLEGVDVPEIFTIMDLSPTLVRGLWRQKIGRLVRPAEGKKYGIYIDPVGNVVHHSTTGNIYENIEWAFKGRQRSRPKASKEAEMRFCPKCYAYMGDAEICMVCGAAIERRRRPIPEQQGTELVEMAGGGSGNPEKMAQNISLAEAKEQRHIPAMYRILREEGTHNRKAALRIYYMLRRTTRAVDIELLTEIQRRLGFKPGWVWYAKKLINGSIYYENPRGIIRGRR